MNPPNDSRVPAARILDRGHATGVTLVLVAGLMLSLSGVTLRHIESASGWQILFYRSLTFFVVVTLYLVFRYRTRVVRAFVTTGRPGLVVAVSLGLGVGVLPVRAVADHGRERALHHQLRPVRDRRLSAGSCCASGCGR